MATYQLLVKDIINKTTHDFKASYSNEAIYYDLAAPVIPDSHIGDYFRSIIRWVISLNYKDDTLINDIDNGIIEFFIWGLPRFNKNPRIKVVIQ